MQEITASQVIKRSGLKSLNQVSEMTGQSPQTLINWYKNKRALFDIVIKGCLTTVDQQHLQHVVRPVQHNVS